jgi:hypothetical protein
MAFMIHGILPQNIIKNPNKQDYKSIVAVTFIFRTLAYTFITEGAFGNFAIIKPSLIVNLLKRSHRLLKTSSKWIASRSPSDFSMRLTLIIVIDFNGKI